MTVIVFFFFSPGCNAELGGFAGLFDLKAAGFVDPILVSGTDGVGTKLKVGLDIVFFVFFCHNILIYHFSTMKYNI